MKNLHYTYGNEHTLSQIYNEIMERKSYEIFFDIQQDSIVMDAGAMIGLFTLTALDKAKKIYVIEPDPTNFNDLKNNIKNYDKCIFINEAIGFDNSLSLMSKYNGSGNIFEYNKSEQDRNIVLTRKFRDIIENYKIDKIDFLKCDCEGGEYSIFVPENGDLFSKINFISGELHNETVSEKQSDVFNTENMLNVLNCLEEYYNVIYTSVDNVRINKNQLRNSLDYYRQFLFYAMNKKLENSILVEFQADKTVRATGEYLSTDVNISFTNLDTGESVYSSDLKDGFWSMTTTPSNNWCVYVNNGNKTLTATVSEMMPIKYIRF